LGRQAFCQGDWVDAGTRLVDLAGDDDDVEARMIDESEIGLAPDALLTKYVKTYVEAKRAADRMRAERVKDKLPEVPADDLFATKT
jgi:hypothetical protein